MPSSTVRSKVPHGTARNIVPMSERQQLALVMQMTTNQESSKDSAIISPSRPRNRNERGETPLHLASIKGDLTTVQKLLNEGADPNETDFAGWGPLHEACNHGWYGIALSLLNAGALVNARGFDDFTPLHDAVINNHSKLVCLLIDYGADIDLKNKSGKTAVDVADHNLRSLLLKKSSGKSSYQRIYASSNVISNTSDELKENDTELTAGDHLTTSWVACCNSMEPKSGTEDVYEFKSSKEATPIRGSPASPGDHKEEKEETTDSKDVRNSPTKQEGGTDQNKRNFSDSNEGTDEVDEESKKKKRKDNEAPKENSRNGSSITGRNRSGSNSEKCQKNGSSTKVASSVTKNFNSNSDRKSPNNSGLPVGNSPKVSAAVGSAGNKPVTNPDETETEDKIIKSSDSSSIGPKVPPLKIVIPPQSSASEQEQGNRNGKNSVARHQALPYVVPSSSSEAAAEKESANSAPSTSPTDFNKLDDKKEGANNSSEEQRSHHPRVLRSSHRSSSGGPSPTSNSTAEISSPPRPGSNGSATAERESNNSSPLQINNTQQGSPIPSETTTSAVVSEETSATTVANSNVSEEVKEDKMEEERQPTPPPIQQQPTPPTPQPAPVELHPRKRKMKQRQDVQGPTSSTSTTCEVSETVSGPEVHPHEQPITNCYQLFLNIRKQIERRRKNLFPVQPKPPQGFKDYLMNRCTYVLAGNATSRHTVSMATPPVSLQGAMKDLFNDQEKDRYRLRMQHVIEKEKLVLSVEQEILRVHGRAARALANQSLPFSVCTILKDEEVYNVITPEQEEKDRNARSRYNGRLFLSWLQDVDDKWEKIKESMLLRHHNEAESLHAVQKMDWEWKMKELGICEFKAKPVIEDLHVPMVHVSDDFDLLPA